MWTSSPFTGSVVVSKTSSPAIFTLITQSVMSPASSTSEHLTPSVRNIFKCDQCTSYFESARGLKSHQGRKHKVILSTTLPPIPQVNGTSEKPVMESDFDETFCLLVLSYKNDFERDRGFSLHMFEDHEPHGNDWIKENVQYINSLMWTRYSRWPVVI